MGSSGFFLICLLHSVIALSCGAFMMIYTNDFFVLGHGKETATKLSGSTPHDQLLIKTSDSFSGLLLFAIGFLLFMVAFVKDREFQSFFAKGCVILHVIMAIWRVYFERKLEDLARDLPRQVVGDIVLALSWVFFLVSKVLNLLLPQLGFSKVWVVVLRNWGFEKMGGMLAPNSSSTLALAESQSQQNQNATAQATKPKKKICCACPDTKKLRDECIVEHGETACAKWIEAHRKCLRAEGFNV
ncbi:Cytochrome c oxidase copper chaperone [Dillenia turbinata]|uniref:Cytochrome c oxidase copper chaperone n=1 Tax=Dillenia turbinata TaxID=194707 RepID=A0AAN8VHE1_9MAGN